MDQLRKLCQQRLIFKFGDKVRPLVSERLRQELEMIQTSGQVGSFEKAIRAVEILSGQGVFWRLTGSGCSSLVSYLMDFSQIDPTEHGLPYERFLNANPGRNIQFRFDAHSKINRSEEDFDAILNEVSFDEVRIQKSTALAAIPSLLIEGIRQTDSDFDLTSIPWNDEATFEVLRSRNFEGIYQFEGIEFQNLFPDLKPRSLTDIAAITSIQLCEVHEMGIFNEYIQRDFPQGDQQYEPCLVSETLQETRGMILFQEQIMLIMNRVADIPLADAYSFIKAVCKRQWEYVGRYRDWFVVQAVGNGVDEPDAFRLFEKIRDAATRAVCKSHHLAEAVTTYQAAFLKAHFPSEFCRTLQMIQQ